MAQAQILASVQELDYHSTVILPSGAPVSLGVLNYKYAQRK